MNLRHTAWLGFLLGSIGLSLLTGSALAGPRDDVLSAAQRCTAIPDDRTWLDCYYGSAQSMRGRLGLPPAPAGQVRLVPPAMAPAYGPGPAPTYAPGPAPVYGVQATPQPQYGAPVYAAPTYGTPAVTAAAPAGPPPLPHRRSTGLLGMFGSSKPTVANLRMASYSLGRGGKFSVTLSDGEVWNQDEGDSADSNWRGAASNYVVNVYEGALGTYNMEVSDDSTLYKVHRVK